MTVRAARPVLLALLLALGSLACASPTPIVVGSDLDNSPFAWVDEDGQPAGRDVEMMATIAGMLDRPVVWKRMPFDQLLDAAASGEVDVVCATLGVTPERAERVDFSRPYFHTELAVVVRAGAQEPATLRELRGRRVAAAAGTTSERALKRGLPGAVGVYGAKDGLSSLERLVLGDVDALVMDGPAADALVRDSAGSVVRLPEGLGAERYALALPKDRASLCTSIDACLLTLELGGSLSRWNARYGLTEASSVAAAD